MPQLAPGPLLEIARALLPPTAKAAAVDAGRGAPELHPEEEAAAAGMSDARRREFAAGRRAARLAMAELGVEGQPLRVGHDRAPLWPPGLVGSITHSRFCCIAAVARAAAVASLGIDVEIDDALEDDLQADVLTPEERGWVAGRPDGMRRRAATLIFSAKEAAYKCIYPLASRLIDFQAIEIRPALRRAEFTARFTTDVPPFRRDDCLLGKMGWRAGHVFTAMAMTAPPGLRRCERIAV